MTYEEAEKLYNRGKRKLEYQTTLGQHYNGDYYIQLYATDVVLIHPDGTYTVNHGGWQTQTTMKRIEKYSPAVIFTKYKGHKRVGWAIGDVLFVNSLRINASGQPIDFDFHYLREPLVETFIDIPEPL